MCQTRLCQNNAENVSIVFLHYYFSLKTGENKEGPKLPKQRLDDQISDGGVEKNTILSTLLFRTFLVSSSYYGTQAMGALFIWHGVWKSQKSLILKIWNLWSNSVTRQVNFKNDKNWWKCRNCKIQMRHFGWFSNTVNELEFDLVGLISQFSWGEVRYCYIFKGQE